MLLFFNAPAHHRLELPDFDEPINGGETFTLDDERGLEVATDPHLNVIEASGPDSLDDLTRAELDELAALNGLNPKDFKKKQDVIDALSDEPTAEGEGQNETPDPEKEN